MKTMTPSYSPPHEGEKKRQKILILGVKGMLGQALAHVFKEGNELFLWNRDEIDITEAQSAKRKVQSLTPDLVINSAAYNDVDKAELEPENANLVNGHAVGHLASICKELDIPLVHYSTAYVFDGTKKEGYQESDSPNPISAYGRSKFLGEQELQRNADKFYLIRLSRLFGYSPSPLSSPVKGEEIKKKSLSPGGRGEGEGAIQRKKSFVTLMLGLAKTRKEIEVVDEEVSSATYAPDLARKTREIVEAKRPFGIYHCTNTGTATWYGFAQEIFKIAGINVKLMPVPASHFPRPAKRPQYAVLLNTKLPPMRSWEVALNEFLTTPSSSPP